MEDGLRCSGIPWKERVLAGAGGRKSCLGDKGTLSLLLLHTQLEYSVWLDMLNTGCAGAC